MSTRKKKKKKKVSKRSAHYFLYIVHFSWDAVRKRKTAGAKAVREKQDSSRRRSYYPLRAHVKSLNPPTASGIRRKKERKEEKKKTEINK